MLNALDDERLRCGNRDVHELQPSDLREARIHIQKDVGEEPRPFLLREYGSELSGACSELSSLEGQDEDPLQHSPPPDVESEIVATNKAANVEECEAQKTEARNKKEAEEPTSARNNEVAEEPTSAEDSFLHHRILAGNGLSRDEQDEYTRRVIANARKECSSRLAFRVSNEVEFEALERFEAEDLNLPYWARRCLDCWLYSTPFKQHTNFDSNRKRDLINEFCMRLELPEGIPDACFPTYVRRCVACKALFRYLVRGRVRCDNCSVRLCQECNLRPVASAASSSCDACLRPPCQNCSAVPCAEVPSDRRESDGTYVCDRCRYPPCSGCRVAERPKQIKYAVSTKPAWYCKSCRTWKTCKECRSEKPPENFAFKSRVAHHRCLQCEYPTCSECGITASGVVREQEKEPDEAFVCQTCNFPPCSGCGRRKRPQRREYKKTKMSNWYCDYKTCQAKKKARL